MELLLATRERYREYPKAIAWHPKGSIIDVRRKEDIRREWVWKLGHEMQPARLALHTAWPYRPHAEPLWRIELLDIARKMRENLLTPDEAWDALISEEPRLMTHLPEDTLSGLHVTDLWPFTFLEKQKYVIVRFDDGCRLPLHAVKQVGAWRRRILGVPMGATRPIVGRLYRINYWDNPTLGLDPVTLGRAENDSLTCEPLRSVVLDELDLSGNRYTGANAENFDPFDVLGVEPPARGADGGPGVGGAGD